MNTESEIPVTGLYADEAPSGYIEPPTNTQFHAGVEPEMTLPAAWWNYFVNLFTNTNIKAKEDITAILTELNNALTGGGVTPDPEATNQLLTLLRKGPGSGLDADLLDGQHGNYYAPKANPTFTGVLSADSAQIANTFIDSGVYLTTQDGFLIKTDIPQSVIIMAHLEFTMNTFDGGYPCIGIVQCYPYPPASAIVQSGYSAIGGAPAYCRIFFTDNVLCFWLPKTGNGQTLHPVLHTNASGYKIVSTTAAALPASRSREVTANVLLPWSSINDGSGSGLDADTVDGSHYNANDILTKLKTVDGPGSGLDADLLDGLEGAAYAYGQGSMKNANDAARVGFYRLETPFINGPTATAYYIINFPWGNGSDHMLQLGVQYNGGATSYRVKVSGVWGAWNKIWTATNDGHGSGLDADLLDGLEGAAYAKLNTATSSTATELPVGSYIMASGESAVQLNDSVPVSIAFSSYKISTGPDNWLSGTWRVCGYAQDTNSSNSYKYYLVRRVA